LQAGVVTAGNGNNQDTLPLEFGVGTATSAQVIIVWPNGVQEVHDNISVNRKVTFTEGS
jgi:hypothetical protein